MDESVYHLHYQREESHWWFAARSTILREIIRRFGNVSPGDTILDIGCGTGALMKALSSTYNMVGIDMSPLAVQYSRQRGLNALEMRVQDFPRDKYNVRAALLLDVIEHIDEDIEVLKNAAEIVRPDGRVIVTVPAYMWMWSAHDVLNHHKRRYTATTLRHALESAGLEVVKLTYYNTLLFPLAAIKKFLDRGKSIESASKSLEQPSSVINTLFRMIFAAERHVIQSMRMPFGVSILAIARPKEN
jgi:2-polyprenyl-3-methyl-5-hydroxy-6-metoxy-1,4-benzoquinol methylase